MFNMGGTVQLTIRVRKYLWKEFVHDISFAAYVTLKIANELSKRFFNRSIPQLFQTMFRILKWTFWISMISVWSYLIIANIFGWR